jgi:phasin family protein
LGRLAGFEPQHAARAVIHPKGEDSMFATTKFKTDRTSVSDQLSSFLHDLKLPSVVVDETLASQSKNIEAFTKAMLIATEGADAVARRQSDILQTALDQAAVTIRELSRSGSPEKTSVKQAELVKKALETAVANAHELAAMVQKSNEEAFEVVNRRMTESIDEIHKVALKKFFR